MKNYENVELELIEVADVITTSDVTEADRDE